MFRRLTPLFVMMMLLSVALVACGDSNATVPTYPGATSITVPDSIKTQFGSSVKDLKNTKYEAFKTTDSADKVKASFLDSFKKDGWEDKVSKSLKPEDVKQIESVGMFVLGYQKGSKGAVVMGIPGSISGALGFSGVAANESAYFVISGDE